MYVGMCVWGAKGGIFRGSYLYPTTCLHGGRERFGTSLAPTHSPPLRGAKTPADAQAGLNVVAAKRLKATDLSIQHDDARRSKPELAPRVAQCGMKHSGH